VFGRSPNPARSPLFATSLGVIGWLAPSKERKTAA
jgi:hypothetical protein